MLSLSALCAMSVAAFAESEPQGYVTFYADKAVLGQGLVVEPQSVPFYDGDTGIDIVKRAAEVNAADGEWGAYIEGFADTDTGAELPAEIAAVCPEMFGRNTEGWLCAYDYTAESGWSWFLNGESSSAGISDYIPADGDVIQYRFTVYGYGSDLGIDNTSWGGAPALVEMVDTTRLAQLIAVVPYHELPEYNRAMELLGGFGASQSDINKAYIELSNAAGKAADDAADDKTSADTGAEGIAVAVGAAAIAGAAMLLSKKR